MELVWVYNSRNGAVQRWPETTAHVLLKSGTGWHGPFKTKEEALAFYESGKVSNPGWVAPTGIIGNITSPFTQGVKEIFGGLDLQAWLVRIGEIVLGIVLIAVGMLRITGSSGKVAEVLKVIK